MRRIILIISVLFFTTLSVSAQSSSPPAIQSPKFSSPITITPTPSAVGDPVVVLGDTYRIIEMEFVRYDTDVPYIIKFPALNNPATATEPGLTFVFFNTQWVNDSNAQIMLFPQQVQVSGFPAAAAESQGSGHSFVQSMVPNVPLPGALTVRYDLGLTLSVAIGPETIATITYSQGNMQQQETTIDDLIDIIPLFDVIPMRAQRLMEINELRTLLNYVEFRVKGTQARQ